MLNLVNWNSKGKIFLILKCCNSFFSTAFPTKLKKIWECQELNPLQLGSEAGIIATLHSPPTFLIWQNWLIWVEASLTFYARLKSCWLEEQLSVWIIKKPGSEVKSGSILCFISLISGSSAWQFEISSDWRHRQKYVC